METYSLTQREDNMSPTPSPCHAPNRNTADLVAGRQDANRVVAWQGSSADLTSDIEYYASMGARALIRSLVSPVTPSTVIDTSWGWCRNTLSDEDVLACTPAFSNLEDATDVNSAINFYASMGAQSLIRSLGSQASNSNTECCSNPLVGKATVGADDTESKRSMGRRSAPRMLALNVRRSYGLRVREQRRHLRQLRVKLVAPITGLAEHVPLRTLHLSVRSSVCSSHPQLHEVQEQSKEPSPELAAKALACLLQLATAASQALAEDAALPGDAHAMAMGLAHATAKASSMAAGLTEVLG